MSTRPYVDDHPSVRESNGIVCLADFYQPVAAGGVLSSRQEECQARIRDVLAEINTRLTDYARGIQACKEYLWEARRDMDYLKKISVRQIEGQTLDTAEMLQTQREKTAEATMPP